MDPAISPNNALTGVAEAEVMIPLEEMALKMTHQTRRTTFLPEARGAEAAVVGVMTVAVAFPLVAAWVIQTV